MFKFFKNRKRKSEAKKHGIPMFIKKHWQAYWHAFKTEGELLSGCNVLYFTHGKVGLLVPLLEHDGVQHIYKITRVSIAAGSDHIVSPRQYDMEYQSTIAV